VTIVGRRRTRPGIRVHRVQPIDPRDITNHCQLRRTSPARTLIDFACQASGSEVGEAFGEARAKRLLTDRALASALARARRNHRGAVIVRAMLQEGDTYDRSQAEHLMRRHLRAAGLPQPLSNVMLHGHLVDFAWPDHGLIVEAQTA
jgi:hypothetical protein